SGRSVFALRAMMQLRMNALADESENSPPARRTALLLAIVEQTMLVMPPAHSRPPPSRCAILPLIVQFVIETVNPATGEIPRPPPSVPEALPEIVLRKSVTPGVVATVEFPVPTKMPPPSFFDWFPATAESIRINWP